jgi:hypothetical protein
MAMPSKVEVLYTGAGADNTAFTSPAIDVSQYDYIGYRIGLTGGVAPAAVTNALLGYAADGTTTLWSKGNTVTTGASSVSGTWGPGCTISENGGAALGAPLPPTIRIQHGAFGIGITTVVTVYGRRNARGPEASLLAD